VENAEDRMARIKEECARKGVCVYAAPVYVDDDDEERRRASETREEKGAKFRCSIWAAHDLAHV